MRKEGIYTLFETLSLPLCKGELEGVVVNTNRTFSHPHSFVYKVINPMTFWYFISVIYRLFLLILLHEPRYPGG